jgi:hypothetical protein
MISSTTLDAFYFTIFLEHHHWCWWPTDNYAINVRGNKKRELA